MLTVIIVVTTMIDFTDAATCKSYCDAKGYNTECKEASVRCDGVKKFLSNEQSNYQDWDYGCKVSTCEWICEHEPSEPGKRSDIEDALTNSVLDVKYQDSEVTVLAENTNDTTTDYELLSVVQAYEEAFSNTTELETRDFNNCIAACQAVKQLSSWCPNNAVSLPLSGLHIACVGACHAIYNR